MASMIECPECGGWGGEPGSNFGDHGFHPCFYCGATGFVTVESMVAWETRGEAARMDEVAGSTEGFERAVASVVVLTDDDIPF